MKQQLLRFRHLLLLVPFPLIFAAGPVSAQQVPARTGRFQAGIEAAAVALGNNPRFKGRSLENRKQVVEFVVGNMLFVLLHELGHTAIGEMDLPVLGKEEDAADSFAATRLIRIGSEFTGRVLTEAAEGWFMDDRRDRKEGNSVPYYDVHGLDQVRAYQIVCFMVGADKDRFKDLANETKLPADRQDLCARDYSKAASSWAAVLKPYLRAPDQPETKINVTYGDGIGRLATAAEVFRSVKMLEIVAEHQSDLLLWPEPFALEMQSCGFINARWDPETRKLTLCYELAADFAELYRDYGSALAEGRKGISRTAGRKKSVRKSETDDFAHRDVARNSGTEGCTASSVGVGVTCWRAARVKGR